jgi:hypothetical protein
MSAAASTVPRAISCAATGVLPARDVEGDAGDAGVIANVLVACAGVAP